MQNDIAKAILKNADSIVDAIDQYLAKADDDLKKMRKILSLLDDEDDVQNVYHNWDEPDEE